MPTVGELYGATSTTNAQFINDPEPEARAVVDGRAERREGLRPRPGPLDALRRGHARFPLLADRARPGGEPEHQPRPERRPHRHQRIEAALNSSGWLLAGLDLSGSVTYADSKIKANGGFVAIPGDTIGKWQPNVPRWRATALASYRWSPQWSTSIGARYSGRQYRTLNNSDVNGYTYQGVSKFATRRCSRPLSPSRRQWSAALRHRQPEQLRPTGTSIPIRSAATRRN